MSPKYLYKILESDPGQPLSSMLPLSALDKQDGFIHLSTLEQTPVTARLFFSQHTTLWVLKLVADRLDGPVRYSTDPAAGVQDGCAHLHDSKAGLGRENTEEVIVWRRREGEEWGNLAQEQ